MKLYTCSVFISDGKKYYWSMYVYVLTSEIMVVCVVVDSGHKSSCDQTGKSK